MTGGMMFKGTPGPWEHNARTGEFGPTNEYSPVGQIYGGDENGFLVAAAPELLEALMPTMNLAMWTESAADDELVIMSVGTVRKMRAAIAKALGEQK